MRLINLVGNLPVVGDESIYLRWAEIIEHQGEWFVSLLDGKPPLSYWLYAVCRFILPSDPLLGPRVVSAVAGTLATFGIFRIGVHVGGRRAGLAAASLYAVLPWAMVYDRLAYAESLVNLAGVAIAWAAIAAFDRERSEWLAVALAGLMLGLGLFTKTTALLFFHVPLLAALLWKRESWRSIAPKLGLLYAIALVFPCLSWLLTPDAPQLESSNVLLHKTHFFYSPAEFAASPLAGWFAHAGLFGESIIGYLTWPGVVAALAAAFWLARRSTRGCVFLLGLSVLPLLVEMTVLTKYFSRYPFPHIWPLLVLIGMAFATLSESHRPKTWAAVSMGLVFVAMAVGSIRIVSDPANGLAPLDRDYYFSDSPNAGWGLAEAFRHLDSAAGEGRLLLLTDPIWGTPADAAFAYVNGHSGIEVREAWWIEQSRTEPLLPAAQIEVWRSHYQRVLDGSVDMRDFARVYYLTVTNYHSREEVHARSPRATLEFSHPKPGGRHSLDLWRLR